MNKQNPAIGGDWQDTRKELFTPEEIAQSDLRVMLVGEIITARNDKGISQRKLAELSGVSQPVIARLEAFDTKPTLETVQKILNALGKTITVSDIPETKAS